MKPFLALAALLLLQDPKPAEFLPTKEGTTWVYVTQNQEMKVRIVGVEKVGEIECRVHETGVAGQVQRDYFSLTAEGLHSVKVAVGERVVLSEPPVLRLKFPLKKDDAWEWKGRQAGRETKASFVNEGEEEIAVPAGKYKAWKIVCGLDTEAGGSTSTSWYAAGVGMIRQDTAIAMQGRILKVSTELKSFEPGK